MEHNLLKLYNIIKQLICFEEFQKYYLIKVVKSILILFTLYF